MRIENLGQHALFLIPSVKVYGPKYSWDGRRIAKVVHEFLLANFNGYTVASGNIYGYFQSTELAYDELREFRVAFLEDEEGTKVPRLQQFLADLCRVIGEECIYLQAGKKAMLIYPD
jgi:hypothetical protein